MYHMDSVDLWSKMLARIKGKKYMISLEKLLKMPLKKSNGKKVNKTLWIL